MKNLKRITFAVMITLFAVTAPRQASAMGWEDVPDGYTYQDADGCIHHVHTQQWKLFGITWDTRVVDDLVACPQ